MGPLVWQPAKRHATPRASLGPPPSVDLALPRPRVTQRENGLATAARMIGTHARSQHVAAWRRRRTKLQVSDGVSDGQ